MLPSGYRFLFLFSLFCVVLCTNSAFTGPPESVCDYKHPEITSDSGPVELLVLTLNPPKLVVWPQTGNRFTIDDGLCVQTNKNVSFPCISECHFEYCWLTLKIADITGVEEIHIFSGPDVYATGVYKRGAVPSKDDYLSLQSPAVQCINDSFAHLSWKVKKPSQVYCSSNGSYHFQKVNPTEDANTGEVTMNISFVGTTFQAFSCFVNVKDVFLISEYIVVWQADSPLFLTANGMETNNRLLNSTSGPYTFSWLTYAGNVENAETFFCSDPSHVICSGVTTANESGKCGVVWDEKSFQHTVTVHVDTNVPVVRYCTIGDKVLEKSIYLLDGGNEKLLQSLVWSRLNGADAYIKETFNHMLWLQGVQPDDVICTLRENILTCRIEPDNIRIYLLVRKAPSTQILDTLTVKEAFTFTASLWRCGDHTLIFDVEGSSPNMSDMYTTKYTDGQVNVTSALFAILRGAFQHSCWLKTDYDL